MKTILIVDDEFGIVETLSDLLEGEGFTVVSAANGRDALLRIGERRPDLAVVDVMMPVMTGIELLQEMRSSPDKRDIPVLLMSAVSRAVATQGVPTTVNTWSFIRKPFEFQDLLDAVTSILGQHGGKTSPAR